METLDNELLFIAQCIQENPKVYCLWYHRRWVSKLHPNMNWKRELALCDKLLRLDSRNFHCWNYRRFVELQLGSDLSDELAFTEKKISENFSNYSAWHQRSLLLTAEFGSDTEKFVDQLRNEIAFVKNAFFVEPSDQSAWIYYDWILGKLGLFKKCMCIHLNICLFVWFVEGFIGKDEFMELIEEEKNELQELLDMEPD